MRSDFAPAFQKNTISDSSVKRHMTEGETASQAQYLPVGSVVTLPNGKTIEIIGITEDTLAGTSYYTTLIDGITKENDILSTVKIKQAAQRGTLEIVSGGFDAPKVVEVDVIEVEGEINDIDFPTEDDRRYDENFWARVTPLANQEIAEAEAEALRMQEMGDEQGAEAFYSRRNVEIRQKYYPVYQRGEGKSNLVSGHMAGHYKYTITYPNI